MRWGFPGPKGPLINARSERLAEAPTFRAAARERRCLIPVTAWYEWTNSEGRKLPWRVRARSGLLALAGVWQGAEDPAFAVVTRAANKMLAPYHHRMPVIVAPEDFALWLGEAGHGAARLMRPLPADGLMIERVSEAVNAARFEGPVVALDEG